MESEPKKSACRKWQIILGEYVLGTVDERDRARLERHLARCERCRRELAETEKMYRLLGDFELAKPGPFFAAKVARAVRGGAEAVAPEPADERPLAGFGRWMRRPAVASAVAAASLAVVAAVLYVNIWLPRAPQELVTPTAGEVAPAAGKLAAAPAREKETPPPEEKRGAEPWRARAGAAAPGEVALPSPATSVTGEAAADE
ncbi:MAG: zf-HC2 domain-containing protein, partial [bacterium]